LISKGRKRDEKYPPPRISRGLGFDFEKAFDYENGFYLTGSPSRLAKSIAHWELYKKIAGLPGEVVECGVYKGASLIRFATYREMLESQMSRTIIGFDAFGKFPDNVTLDSDKAFIKKFEGSGGYGISKEELEQVILRKKWENIVLVKGLIPDVFAGYFSQKPETRIAFLHIDVDVYEATKASLDGLFDRVVKGGLIVFDDYGRVDGATLAIDEFVSEKAKNAEIGALQKLPFNYIPAFCVKN